MDTIRIGYARCSTDRQDLTAQRCALVDLGVDPRAHLREYQNPWGQRSRHRRLERPNVDLERPLALQTEDGLAV